ncbi:MAG: transposase [Burkholderia sp.]
MRVNVNGSRSIYATTPFGASVRRSEKFVAENAKRLRLIRLAGYYPKLDPDKLLKQDVKTKTLDKSRPTSKEDMIVTVRRNLHRRQKERQLMRNLFRRCCILIRNS